MTLNESCSSSNPDIAAVDETRDETGSGKVIHDLRGNAVWEWAIATGVLAGTKAAELLRMLDDPTLAIECGDDLAYEWAGDPYNRR